MPKLRWEHHGFAGSLERVVALLSQYRNEGWEVLSIVPADAHGNLNVLLQRQVKK